VNVAIITDYLNRFGSKQKSQTYRGGMDVQKIIELFRLKGCNVRRFNFINAVELFKISEPHYIIYTSSEDIGEHYKSFIEDIIFALNLTHHMCIPHYKFLRAHNNKVQMELLRELYEFPDLDLFASQFIATEKDIENVKFQFPQVIKGHTGALSKNVFKVNSLQELKKSFNKVASTLNLYQLFRGKLRQIKHGKNYRPEETKIGKMVCQNFLPGINYDWKVLVFYDQLFVLKRENRKNDFRASGSGLFSFTKDIPREILDFSLSIRKRLHIPNLSLDIAIFEGRPVVFEFQALYFGTKTLENSNFHFIKDDLNWHVKEDIADLEEIYVSSVVNFIIQEVESTVHK
jgi:glutathione synthase/RimK-type ligase-like ATP-grasp enzyme